MLTSDFMQTSDFHYNLPPELIAHYPLEQRSASRLLCLDGQTGDIVHGEFRDILQHLHAGDLLVLNNTKVIPARLLGNKASGGKVEVLVERIISEHRVLAHTRASKSPKPGTKLILENAVECEVLGRQGELFELAFEPSRSVLEWLEAYGHMPLPPYIERADEAADKERYQTVFAKKEGAVAAPTAGLHFTPELLQRARDKGVKIAEVTLHVGAGTFQPVRVDNIHEHKMHAEYIDVSAEVVDSIRQTKAQGGRVVAIGTTVVRSLESACISGELQPTCGDTSIFIYPGYRFRCIDAMVTNFHLPESTLLMLVSAFAGKANIDSAYRAAIEHKYRFFSYGDAMFISRPSGVITRPSEPKTGASEESHGI